MSSFVKICEKAPALNSLTKRGSRFELSLSLQTAVLEHKPLQFGSVLTLVNMACGRLTETPP